MTSGGGRRHRSFLRTVLLRALMPFVRLHPYLIPLCRISTYEFGGDTNIQPTAQSPQACFQPNYCLWAPSRKKFWISIDWLPTHLHTQHNNSEHWNNRAPHAPSCLFSYSGEMNEDSLESEILGFSLPPIEFVTLTTFFPPHWIFSKMGRWHRPPTVNGRVICSRGKIAASTNQ